MSLEYDPVSNLRHYPAPMGKYGQNPFGENLYRIVFRQSRRHLVGGEWAASRKLDGTLEPGGTGYHWVPKYPTIKAAWILERWRPESLTKSQWDRDMVDPISGWLLFGPYPSRGDYDLVWEFDQGVAADSLDTIVAFAENEKPRRSFQDLRDRLQSSYDAESREMRTTAYEDIRDGMTAFGTAPMSAGKFGRGTKTAAPVITAEEARLPTPRRLPAGNGARIGELQVSNSLSAGVRI